MTCNAAWISADWPGESSTVVKMEVSRRELATAAHIRTGRERRQTSTTDTPSSRCSRSGPKPMAVSVALTAGVSRSPWGSIFSSGSSFSFRFLGSLHRVSDRSCGRPSRVWEAAYVGETCWPGGELLLEFGFLSMKLHSCGTFLALQWQQGHSRLHCKRREGVSALAGPRGSGIPSPSASAVDTPNSWPANGPASSW